MTITLTMDWLVYVYWLIENYVFVRIQELKVQQYYAYHERLVEMMTDCIQSQAGTEKASYLVEPVLAPVIPIKPVVIQSELDEKAEALFAELQLELDMVSETPAGLLDEPYVTYEREEDFANADYEYEIISLSDYDGEIEQEKMISVTSFEEEVVDNQDDCIQMVDLLTEEAVISPDGYEAFASAKIQDALEGPQQWVVSVIGMEEEYIHVSDGKRIWLNIGEKASKIRKNDVLMVDVIRNGKEVSVQNLVRVETFATDEYLIPDEERFLREEEDVRIAI